MAISSHVIPKFYLDQFSTPSQRKNGQAHVWVYEKGKKPRYTATKVQGAEKGYFASVRPDGELDESMEVRLERLEEACLDTLVLARSPLADLNSPSRRNSLAFYSAMLFCRARQRRDRSQKAWVKVQKDFADSLNDDDWVGSLALECSAKYSVRMTNQEIRDRFASLSKTMRTPASMRNNFVEDLIPIIENLKVILIDKPWQVWRAPEGVEFITSDNPLVTYIEYGKGFLNPGHGFRKDGVVAVFPVAPCACLAMGVSGPESVTLEAERVTKINEVIIPICDKYVYSKTFSADIEARVNKYGGSARYGETVFLPLGIKVPTARDFIRQVLKLD
jgi:Protein of unknown function (DUF4238)